MEKYQIKSTYQEARYKAILAVLKTTLNVDIEDFLSGEIIVSKDGEKLATLNIEELL